LRKNHFLAKSRQGFLVDLSHSTSSTLLRMKSLLFASLFAMAVAQDLMPGDVPVTIFMALDGNATASDIGWALTSESEDFQVAVPFGAYSSSSVINDQVIVPGGKDYTFTIKDQGGEGLGENGYYELILGESFGNYTLVTGYSNFTNDESSTTFYMPAFEDEILSNETAPPSFVIPTRGPALSPTVAPGGGGGPFQNTNTIPPDSAVIARISQLLVGSMVAAAALLL
jgi:hypothetical protein